MNGIQHSAISRENKLPFGTPPCWQASPSSWPNLDAPDRTQEVLALPSAHKPRSETTRAARQQVRQPTEKHLTMMKGGGNSGAEPALVTHRQFGFYNLFGLDPFLSLSPGRGGWLALLRRSCGRLRTREQHRELIFRHATILLQQRAN